MRINFNRRKIESICIFLSFILVILLVIFGILSVADELFNWDILSDKLENVAILLMSATGMVIGATFLISLMVNFSLISLSLEKIADKLNSNQEKNG
jgi:ribose/xylose/arabinose/galactoside ABC-type transport system permease subunit